VAFYTLNSGYNNMNTFNVAKFGGTSMADFDAMDRCAQIILADENIRLVVVSASSGITNKLTALASPTCTDDTREQVISQITEQHNDILASISNEKVAKIQLDYLLMSLAKVSTQIAKAHSLQLVDELLSFGELLSSLIFTEVLRRRIPNAELFDARTVMQTDSFSGHAEPQIEQIKHMTEQWLLSRCQQNVVVTQGFIGSDENGKTTTLGRGGSDYSAALFAEALDANNLQIWTDVDGVYTTDPRMAPNARSIPELNFCEAAELSTFGAKILHPSTLWPAIRQNISVYVGSSRDRTKPGTWIKREVSTAPNFRALATRANQTLLTVTSLSMLHSYGFLAKVFAVLAEHKISVDLVTTSEVSVAITLDVVGSQPDTDSGLCLLRQEVIDQLSELGEVKIKHGLALIALVGNGIEQQSGVSARVFSALSPYNLRMICHGASGHNICFLVEQSEASDVVCSLHRELFE
jgi:aspartate kinase